MIDTFTIPQVYAPPVMPDKPNAAPTHEFHLTDHGILALHGRDSLAFAQSQFMNDVRLLGDGQWQWSGWLNAKGRVIALFALLRIDAETLWLLLPDVAADALAEKLQCFLFRSKLALAPRTDLCVSAGFIAPTDARGNVMAVGAGDIELDCSAATGPRRLRIGPACAAQQPDAVARWAAFDLRHGLPRLPASQAEQWTPQQLSLERLLAFSISKGCYPGQEIVARTHFLGQAKRGICLLHATPALAVGEAIGDGDHSLGTVVAAAEGWALAVLPLAGIEHLRSANGQPVEVLPIATGLAR